MTYKLRWNIETFFAWWKRLKVYPLIPRSRYGLMVQMLAGLISYILLAIYWHSEFGEKVSIRRVQGLRIKIRNEARAMETIFETCNDGLNQQHSNPSYANT